MARQTNILSFDEARRDAASSRRASSSSSRRTGVSSGGAAVKRLDDFPTFESPFRQAAGNSTRAGGRTSTRATTRSAAAAASATRRPLRGYVDVSDDFPASAVAPRGAHARRARADERDERIEQEELREPEKRSRLAEMKRTHAKNKAERKFSKQFGGDGAAASGVSEGGSRAAVYKGEMGSKHRHAARMQNEASGQASAKRGFSLGSLAALKSSRKFIAVAAVTACLVLSCSFLYPGAQQYYHAVRDRDRLAAEYAALEERNNALETDVAALQTDAGIEDRAHKQLGWVKEGEQTANVRGLDLPEESSTFRANITSDSIEAPTTWYSPFLDPLFGVE